MSLDSTDNSEDRNDNSITDKNNVISIIKIYCCDICDSTFEKPNRLLRHKKIVHKLEIPVSLRNNFIKYNCRICHKRFTLATNRWRHEMIAHQFKYKFVCGSCEYLCLSKVKFLEHMTQKHSKPNTSEELTFKSLLEFKNWKSQMEKNTLSSYNLTKTYETKSSSIKLFICNRNGYFKNYKKDIHCSKLSIDKIGSFCPANIHVEINKQTNNVLVKHFFTHIGHYSEVESLKPEEDQTASESCTEVPAPYIAINISDTTSSVASSQIVENTPIKSNDFIYQEVTLIDRWVKKITSEDYNPILLYKLPGKYDSKFPDLKDTDFILGFMNSVQKDIFRIYGDEVFSISTTQENNAYNVQLTSIIIKDDRWEGFPVTFLWSNRQHEDIFKYFFEAIKEQIGNFKVKVFISDDYPTFYSMWCHIFNVPDFYILYDTCVRKEWENYLSSGLTEVKNLEKRQQILNTLYLMANEVDRTKFEKFLKIIEINLSQDPETMPFGCYFALTYSSRPQQWAACYRTCANIYPTITIENWHKDLNYSSSLQEKCNGKLNETICSLITSLQIKFTNKLSTLQQEKLMDKFCLIRKIHEDAEKMKKDVSVYKQDDKTWIITSASYHYGEIYKVNNLILESDHKCNLICQECDVCFHKLSCNCSSYTINYDMCKHIHIISMKKDSTIYDDLMINIHFEPTDKSSDAIHKAQSQDQTLTQLKEKAVSVIMSLLPEIENFNTEEQCKELIKILPNSKLKSLEH